MLPTLRDAFRKVVGNNGYAQARAFRRRMANWRVTAKQKTIQLAVPAERLRPDPLRPRPALRHGSGGVPAVQQVDVISRRTAKGLWRIVSTAFYTPIGLGRDR